MAQVCRVNNCAKSRKHGITLHRIPPDSKLAKQWMDFIAKSGKNLRMSVDDAITRKIQICSDHFTAECYDPGQLRRKEMGFSALLTLKLGSIPSILTENVTATPCRKSNRDSVRKKLEAAREKEATMRQSRARKGLDFSQSGPVPDTSDCAQNIPGPSHQPPQQYVEQPPQDREFLPSVPSEHSFLAQSSCTDPSGSQTDPTESQTHPAVMHDSDSDDVSVLEDLTTQALPNPVSPVQSDTIVVATPPLQPDIVPAASTVAGIVSQLQGALSQGPLAIKIDNEEPQWLLIDSDSVSNEGYNRDIDSPDSSPDIRPPPDSSPHICPPPPSPPDESTVMPPPISPSTSDMDSIIMPPPQKPVHKKVTMCTIGVQTLLTKTVMDEMLSPNLEAILSEPETAFVSDTDEEINREGLAQDHGSDPDYVQSEFESASSCNPTPVKKREDTYVPRDNNRLFLVYEEMLMSLFLICMRCKSAANAQIQSIVGTAVTVVQICSKKGCSGYEWCSQPLIGRSQYRKGNIMLSTSVLVSGSHLSKVFRMFEYLGVPVYDESSFYNHQRKYLHGAVLSTWQDEQKQLLADSPEAVEVSGDARCDSMGHCAKYGAYSFLDTLRNKFLCMALVQKNEVASSYHMELKGLERCREVLERLSKIKHLTIVTDRHPQINKWIKEKWSAAKHYFDIWHVAKGFKKKLDALAKKFPSLKEWVPGIVNHLYWCATTSNGDGELVVAKWKSLANHIVDVHEHEDSKFPKCAHGSLPPKLWLKADSAAYEELHDLMHSTRHLKDVARLSPSGQTGSLEGFHSLVNQFAPKMLHFSHAGMKSRLLLAVLHYNENSDREYKVNKEGKESWNMSYARSRGEKPLVRRIKEEATHKYATTVTEKVIYFVNNPREAEELEKEIKESTPAAPSHDFPKADKQAEIEKHKTRFAQE